MRVVVVGANGFLGSHMVDTLVGAGHDVTAVDRFGSPPRYSATPARTITTDNPGESDMASELAGADAVMDFLGASTPALSARFPNFDTEVTLPTANALIRGCIAAGVGHYYFASTGGAIYGDSGRESNREEDPPAPISAYGKAKLALETTLEQARTAGDLNSTVWRFSNPYGPRQNPAKKQGLIAIAFHHYLTGTPVPVMGSGDMIRDYIYVSDAVEWAASFVGRTTTHSVYNIGSGVGVSVNEVLDTMSDVVGHQLPRISVDTPPGFVHRSVVSVDRVTHEFGERPLMGLREGISSTFQATTKSFGTSEQ
jgi:UDP-glucose 4-epimerase